MVSGFSIWNSGRRGEDYEFFDRTISEYFFVGGTAAYIHLYQGVYDQAAPVFDADGTPILPAVNTVNPTGPETPSDLSIQDVLFLENRDRKYDTTIFELRTIYNVGDSDFDLRQFGMFLTNDTYFLEFHYNDMIALLGRKLMTGDVIELPHQRDEFLLDETPAINKYYQVEDANRASSGYSATWYYHIWRCKVTPMPASQEFHDILNKQSINPLGLPMFNADGSPATLGGLMGTLVTDLGINEAVVNNAIANFTKRYFETQQYWFQPGTTSETGAENPWVFCGDGIPPNGAVLVGQGNTFPLSPTQNEYYLRTDYCPPVLYMYSNNQWRRQEIDWRGTSWNVAHRLLESFINNDTIATYDDGETGPEKVNLSQTIMRPNVDF